MIRKFTPFKKTLLYNPLWNYFKIQKINPPINISETYKNYSDLLSNNKILIEVYEIFKTIDFNTIIFWDGFTDIKGSYIDNLHSFYNLRSLKRINPNWDIELYYNDLNKFTALNLQDYKDCISIEKYFEDNKIKHTIFTSLGEVTEKIDIINS